MYWFGLLCCALLGVEIGGVAAGAVHLTDPAFSSSVLLFVLGMNLIPWTGLIGFAAVRNSRSKAERLAEQAERAERAKVEAAPKTPALARIETSRAVGEGPDLPLLLDLTVAPDGRPGYRVEMHATVNLMDMDAYRAGCVIVVDHDPDRLWRVTLQHSPSPEWRSRATLAKLDSAPASTMVARPLPLPRPGAYRRPGRMGVRAMLVGMAISVGVFWPWFSG
ncbi:hypothetical protein [Streptacidiphilus sp. EB103A]|uniref:hypothetical protein n=1 Tax=Streptacidiphilus sp. EB103A TaxID=3156275 RepID=UPI0035151864